MPSIIEEVIDINGNTHILVSELSRGGQGVVYKTNVSDMAVKLVLNGTEILKNKENDKFEYLRLLPIDKGTNITLPLTILKDYSGYVMRLLEDMASFRSIFDVYDSEYSNKWLDNFKDNENFVDNYGSYIKSGGKRRRIVSYLKLAENLLRLHKNGLVYCDLSTNNIFLSTNEKNNNVWLIDSDNLNFQSLTKGYYTPGFAAPEVIKTGKCTMYSDSYSFAICLFLQLLGTHPFKGSMLDNVEFDDEFSDEVEERANNGELPYIKSDEDTSNDISTSIEYELIISDELKQAFKKIFSEEAKKNKTSRINMHEWCYILAKELDNDIVCYNCEMSYLRENKKKCPWCENENTIISIKSYDSKDNNIWEFTSEIQGDNIKIPLRLIEDYDLNNSKEFLFDIKKINEDLHISKLNNMYNFKISKEKIFGEYITKKDVLKIECVSKETDENILIKLEIL